MRHGFSSQCSQSLLRAGSFICTFLMLSALASNGCKGDNSSQLEGSTHTYFIIINTFQY